MTKQRAVPAAVFVDRALTLTFTAAASPAGFSITQKSRVAASWLAPPTSMLTAPSSTVIQASPVHTGLTHSPEEELDHLFRRLVG